ncbi:NlpC [Rouxiella silvae]|uniref:C40 family peptidase n=1 Tax=Rouxiella silvae TaxID=1646373 RepID=A0AA40X1Y6_9GAMM|nr:NlpC/P60 family protein [Rouxiella silvae]KQN52156.1 NlpC [Serratia sp. Leaf50]MBF6637263.1 C40 family peptidase [Rouxiella silvae]ORJ18906.1 NlpC [Rouxiella silvae]
MKTFASLKKILCISCVLLAGCASKPPVNNANLNDTADNISKREQESDLISVIAALHDQMHSWQGTPYSWGGTKLSGVDCSGFVWRTLKDRFNLPMDRVTTTELIQMGKRVNRSQLQPGDLVFFRIDRQLHVGFYDTQQNFLHASYSKGVMRSSLDNPYWKSVFLEARRLPKEYDAQITLNSRSHGNMLAKN